MPKITERLAFWTRFSTATRLLLGLFLALAFATIIVGLDNPVGIMLGWAGVAALVAELTRRWRRVRNFIILFFVSLFGMLILSFIHEEVVYPLVGIIGGARALESPALDIYSEVTSLVILFFGPVGLFVGFTGGIVLLVMRLAGRRKRRGHTGDT